MLVTGTLILLFLDIGSISANHCSPTNYDTIIRGGPSLPSYEIISRHNITSSDVMLGCHTHCQDKEECVGFNYRTTKNFENCQLTYVTKKKEETKTGDWILMQDVEAELRVWKLVARFSNNDGKNWMKDANYWFDKTSPNGSTTDPSMNEDMISKAFWLSAANNIKITRSDDPTHTALLQTTNNCLNGKTFRQFITSFGNFRNGTVWSNDKCLGSCAIKYGGLYQSTTGFGMHSCNGNIQSSNYIGFWCNWDAGDGAVMMIGGGGSGCSRADHGIGITEENHPKFGGSDTYADFGYETKEARYIESDLQRSYALNLWVR